MDRNTPNTESSLLLKIPKSVLSFSDMSGNSFLMPVAVDNVVAPQQSMQAETKPAKQDDSPKLPELPPVCQLQQPLLMRRSSSPAPKTTVPCSESNVLTRSFDAGQAFNGQQPINLPVSSAQTSYETNESMNWPSSSVPLSVAQAIQPTPIFTGSQSQHNLQPDTISQPSYTQPMFITQESSNLRHEHIFQPPQTTFSSSSNFSSNTPASSTAFPTFSDKSDYYSVSSQEYYSQPPVITPTLPPAYYNSSGMNTSQLPPTYSSISTSQNYNMQHSSNMPTDSYSRAYEPIRPYWLFQDVVENKEVWCGFSMVDSDRLEMAFQQDPQAIVPVDGGRYDAILTERIKKPVYFEANSLNIRRSTWFYSSETTQRFTPFSEDASNILEQHYSTCVTTGQWQKRVNIPKVGSVVFENPQLILFYIDELESWSSLPDSKVNPKAVRRGLPEGYEILGSENARIDHLVFIVQGIGSFCDLRFRTVAECVDGFRDIANKLLCSHFKQEVEEGKVGRVEVLPLAWHAKLHTSEKGFDRCMQNITLPSIPKLRHFTNDTLLDILLYSSPIYCQSIIDTVASELNKLYDIFLKRNPKFTGKVFVAGHSLGSLILFDILAHQLSKDMAAIPNDVLNSDTMPRVAAENINVPTEEKDSNMFDSITSLLQSCQLEEYTELFEKEKIDITTLPSLSDDDLKDLGLPTGPRKRLLSAVHPNQAKSSSESENALEMTTGAIPKNPVKQNQKNVDYPESLIFPFKTSPCMQSIIYPRLQFEPAGFFALGSPISMFLTVRGYDRISDDFRFPTCPSFFHIFHPYDPVAFRIERLIDPNFSAKPVLIPHHKGRKRMHLEIRENLTKVGSEIKQKVLETLKYTWNSLSVFAKAHTFPTAAVEAEVDKLVSEQMSESAYEPQAISNPSLAPSETCGEEIQIGSLNGGRRIDYVLQEKPIEALNDYVFALTSHATYWDSEDTVLMILREIYATDGIVVSSQSNIENKPLVYSEQSSYNAHSSHFDPYAFEGTRTESVPAFYNQNLPASSQSIQMFNNYSAPVSQDTRNIPPLSSTNIVTQADSSPIVYSPTKPDQFIPPPPMFTGLNTQFDSPQPFFSGITTQPNDGPPPMSSATTTQPPLGPPSMSSATTTQPPLGPPPLTGFIKKSPFR